ncbi:MAG: transcriptional repressor [Gemmatimonadaceae bacterium]|nr:transcriptional repressor [Gemmatimonadaceae bacterium]
MSKRRTSQRSAIVRVVRDAPGPLRPLEILDLASRTVPTLGIATVYRQLRRLQDTGEVRSVDLGVNDVRYEPTDRGHHHHFLCRECEEAFDIHGCPGGMAELAPPGFEVEEHAITLYGRCGDCSNG